MATRTAGPRGRARVARPAAHRPPAAARTTTRPRSSAADYHDRLTTDEIVAVLALHGFKDDVGVLGYSGDGGALTVGAAIVLAESGGKIRSRSYNPPHINSAGQHVPASWDRGMWQINSYWEANVSDTCCDNPACATQAALSESKGGRDFSPWVTFKTGAFLTYIPQVRLSIKNTQPGNWVAAGAGDVGKQFASPFAALGALVSFLTDGHNWVRLGEVIGGALLLLMGLAALAYSMRVGDKLGVVQAAAAPVQKLARPLSRRMPRGGYTQRVSS